MTHETWAARSRPRFTPGDPGDGAVRVPDGGDPLVIADEAFREGQVVALTMEGDRVAAVRFARRGPAGRHTALLARPGVAEALDLLPHPEGGWFRETWRAPVRFRPPGYPGERLSATGIYFLLPPGEESMWHVVRSDEVWLWHSGDPLTLDLGGTGERPGPPEPVTLGAAVQRGERPQALVPAGTWQAARPAGDQGTLVSCVVSPGFDFADFRV